MGFDSDGVRTAWDFAADAYAKGQADGRDYYRLEFFGPAQIAMTGNVRGAALLDVGCGSGYFSRAMADGGAKVTAFDISPRMIEHARKTFGSGITYEVLDATTLGDHYPEAAFDVVTACMSLQDMPDVPAVLRGVHRVMKPGGRFVASIEHPCSSTPFREWQRDPARRKQWLCIDRYFEHGAMDYTWKKWSYEFTTAALHVPLETWVGWIRDAGLVIRDLREPRPTSEMVRARPDLEDAARVPYFLMFELRRR